MIDWPYKPSNTDWPTWGLSATNTPSPMVTFIPQGWQCPVCRRVHAPWVASCDCHKQTDYRRMLYTMTSRTDWQRAGYDVEEYDALIDEFEGDDKP